MRAVRSGVRVQSIADALVTLVVALVVGGPALFTHNGFGFDYTNHMWMVWVQEQAISQHLLPTYFINTPSTGIFYPLYMFYGGTLYALTGALGVLIGGRPAVAFNGVSVLSIMSAYGGMVWLARQFGVRSWLAHAPALTFVAGAYYVTNLYGRGAWTEFVATSMLPLVAASGLALLRPPSVRLPAAVLFVVSVVVFAGSHNITLMLGTVMLALLAFALILAIGRRALPAARRVVLVAALAVAAVAVNAWFLVPDIVHANSTHIGAGPLTPWANTTEFNKLSILFFPFRRVPTGSILPALYVQAPFWFLVWSVTAGAAFWSTAGAALRRMAALLVAGLVIVMLCITEESVWDAMPRTFKEIQFPFRLNTYVALLVSGLVIVAVLTVERGTARRRRRCFEVGLAGAAAISCALCVWQLWVPNTRVGASYANWHGVFVSTHLTPATWNASSDYTDVSAPLVVPKGGMLVDPSSVSGDRATLTLNPPPGFAPFAMNLGAGPYAVVVSGGLERVGRDSADDVVVRRRSQATGPVTFTLATAGGAITVGEVVSSVALVVLLLALIFALGMRLCRRRSVPIEGEPALRVSASAVVGAMRGRRGSRL